MGCDNAGVAMMYRAYQAQSDLMWPLRSMAAMSAHMLTDPSFGFAAQPASRQISRQMAAACKVLELAQVTHKRPPWRLDTVLIQGDPVPVVEEVAMTTPFAT